MSLLKKTITIATLVSMLPGTVMANGSKNRRIRRKTGVDCAAAMSESEKSFDK